jgi:hypothetical protein
MDNIHVLQKLFNSCNENIFKLDPLPWQDDNKIIKNIITFSKRRISVKGFQKLLRKDELQSTELIICDRYTQSDLVIFVREPENYIICTELGMIYLNYCLRYPEKNEIEVLNLSDEMLKKVNIEALKKKCDSVFSIDISTQEAIFAFFLLLNGTRSISTAFQLLVTPTGEYLHGGVLILEMNTIFKNLTEDEEIIIKDQKELRNVIGRNGKNGRLAKVFPEVFQREEGKIWFEFSTVENKLIVIKGIISNLLTVIFKDYSNETVLNNLVQLIQRYMINNPVEPYILRDLFQSSNNFEHLLNMHIAAKDLMDSQE